jgi:hypothetical protein
MTLDYFDLQKTYISISKKLDEQLRMLGVVNEGVDFRALQKLLVNAVQDVEKIEPGSKELRFCVYVTFNDTPVLLECILRQGSSNNKHEYTTVINRVTGGPKPPRYFTSGKDMEAMGRRYRYLGEIGAESAEKKPVTREQLFEEKEFVDRELRSCKTERDNAKRVAEREGRYMGAKAFQELEATISQLAQRSQELQHKLGETKKLLRPFPQFFMDAAKEMLSEDSYELILQTAQRRREENA